MTTLVDATSNLTRLRFIIDYVPIFREDSAMTPDSDRHRIKLAQTVVVRRDDHGFVVAIQHNGHVPYQHKR
jgi:hypothetical protein